MNRTIISDFLTGKNVWEYYQLYQKTQWYSQSEMNAFQVLKLKRLLKHCYDNVPYYRSIIDNLKIDIIKFDSLDILKQFPILTKEIIQANYQALIPINNGSIPGVKIKQTAGTTGNVLINRNDKQSRSSAWATYKRFQDWIKLEPNERTLVLMGGHVKKSSIKKRIISRANSLLGNTFTVDIYNTSDETIEKVISLLKSNKFSHIRTYPQFLFFVAQKLRQRDLRFNFKSISTTAEPVMPEHRILFRQVFNAEVFDQYGCGEIGGIAYECEKHEGLHITDERVVIETNALNELIITDLDNYTMPFIRYWNADQVLLSDISCSCGRRGKLIKQIMGRTCDYVIGQNGQFLHWAYFWHLIFDSNVASLRKLKKFQIVQLSKSEIKIRLVSDELSTDECDFITSNIKSRLGDFIISFSYESDIENTKSGKYRPVINKFL